MITQLETVEAVMDPSDLGRSRKKFLSDGLTFDEGVYGVTVAANSGRSILVPWANIAFAAMAPKPTIPPESPRPVTVFQRPVEVVPEKRGPGRPPKAR